MENTQIVNRRVILLDEIRGLSILFMVFFHGAYDLVNIFGINLPWFNGFVMQEILQPIDAGLFVFLAGFACRYSRNNIKRGLLVFGLGMALTAGTAVFMPTELIKFGILHALGSFMLIFGIAQRILPQKISTATNNRPWAATIGFVISILLFAFTYQITKRYLGIFRIPLIQLPSQLYTSNIGFLIGFPNPKFWSADYFPFIPWAFLFSAGTYFGRYTREGIVPSFFYRSHIKWLSWVGRHSLPIYMVHQPIVYGVLWLVIGGIAWS